VANASTSRRWSSQRTIRICYHRHLRPTRRTAARRCLSGQETPPDRPLTIFQGPRPPLENSLCHGQPTVRCANESGRKPGPLSSTSRHILLLPRCTRTRTHPFRTAARVALSTHISRMPGATRPDPPPPGPDLTGATAALAEGRCGAIRTSSTTCSASALDRLVTSPGSGPCGAEKVVHPVAELADLTEPLAQLGYAFGRASVGRARARRERPIVRQRWRRS